MQLVVVVFEHTDDNETRLQLLNNFRGPNAKTDKNLHQLQFCNGNYLKYWSYLSSRNFSLLCHLRHSARWLEAARMMNGWPGPVIPQPSLCACETRLFKPSCVYDSAEKLFRRHNTAGLMELLHRCEQLNEWRPPQPGGNWDSSDIWKNIGLKKGLTKTTAPRYCPCDRL